MNIKKRERIKAWKKVVGEKKKGVEDSPHWQNLAANLPLKGKEGEKDERKKNLRHKSSTSQHKDVQSTAAKRRIQCRLVYYYFSFFFSFYVLKLSYAQLNDLSLIFFMFNYLK